MDAGHTNVVEEGGYVICKSDGRMPSESNVIDLLEYN